MIFKKKIDFYSTSDYGIEKIHTKGKRIEVTDLKSELSEEALKEYKKYNGVCHNGYMYYEVEDKGSGGYIGEAELAARIYSPCKYGCSNTPY